MRNRVLLIATAAFAGGVASTIMAANYLAGPAATTHVEARAPSVLDAAQVKPVAAVSDVTACPDKTWPYAKAGCGNRSGQDVVPSAMPAKADIPVLGASEPSGALEPVRTVAALTSVPASGAVVPLKPERATLPTQAPQPLEPTRTVEFERSIDAANRSVRVIAIDRVGKTAEAASTDTSGAEVGTVQASAVASTIPARSEAAAPTPSPIARAEPAPSTVKAAAAAPDTARVTTGSPVTKEATSSTPAARTEPAAAPQAVPSTRAAAPARDGSVQQDSGSRSRARKLARQDEAPVVVVRDPRRQARRPAEWSEREEPRGYGRSGYYAFDEAPPVTRRPSSGRDSVYGWLGSPD